MTPFVAELVGTAILIVFGDGVVANVVLKGTKGHGGGWIVIAFGWGMGVFVAVFTVAAYSGAHITPAVTVAMAAAGNLPPASVPLYITAQILGAAIGAAIVYLFYRHHYAATDDPDGKLATFCTAPAIRNFKTAFFCEFVGTFLLVFPIFMMAPPTVEPAAVVDGAAAATESFRVGLGTLGALPVGLLVFAIGLSLGGTTGYAINPARDLGPRIAHALLPIPDKRDSDWAYAWIPIVAPLLGGLAATGAAHLVAPG